MQETLALLTKVLGSIEIAILAFDQDQRLRLINPAAERLLAVRADAAQGQRADALDLADCLELPTSSTLKRTFPGGAGSFEVRRAEFREGGRPHQLLAITDLSRALREQERQAWQRLIRVLGHELNNSLAPIRSMASTLRALLERGTELPDWREDANRGLAVIGDRAEALTRFMLGYTALARLPAPNKRAVRLDELVARVVALEQRLPVSLERGEAMTLSADPDQLEQALINLVKNGVEAVLAKGSGGVRVRWFRRGRGACIEVEDDGAGLAATDNLFVPFFTTKAGGSGIGLALARQVVEAHGGSLSLANRGAAPGCVARVTLPP